jgi:hypothetical protein
METAHDNAAAPAAPNPDAIPAELRERDQWVARRGKVLVDPKTGGNAKTNAPSTWGTFDDAVTRSETDGLDGVGFVFAASDPYAFVDLDGCFDPETGEADPWALEVVGNLDSYTKLSTSGRGVHVVVRGEKPGPRCRATVDGHNKVEMYDTGQYMALTGRVLPGGRPSTVEDRGEALAALYRETFPEEREQSGELAEPVSPEMSDEEVVERCRGARNAEKFAALYDDGALDGYGGDHSAADQALVSILSFYTQDPEQLDRLFRGSGLVREKWTSRPDYRERTIRFALSAGRDYYGAERDYPTVNFVDDLEGGNTGGAASAAVPLHPGGPAADSRSVTDTNAASVTYAAPGVGDRDDARDATFPGFPVEALPGEVARFVREASDSLVCPPELVAVPALSVLAAAVGSARVLEVKGGWREFPVLWTTVVADPSSKKTPAQQHAVAPAERRQMAHKAEHERAVEKHKEALLDWEALKKAAAKGTAPPEKPEAPKMRHNLVQDITVEALAARLAENPRGLLAAHDELSGFFRSHDQYKPGGKGDERQKYLSLWSSRMLKVDRKGDDPVIVERPVVSIAGGIQPDVLAELAPGGRADKDDGMVHRFLFAFPDPLRVVDDWSDAEVSRPAELRYGWVHDRLSALEPADDDKPAVVRFTRGGKERFKAEHRLAREEMFGPGFPPRLQHTWSKMSSHLARLSLVLALIRHVAEGDAEDNREVVTEDDVGRAARIVRYFKASARRVHARMRGESREERLLRVLDGFLGEHGGRWKGRSGCLRAALLDRGAHDAPERAEDLTSLLLKLAERNPSLSVKRGWAGKERAVTVLRVAPDASPSPATGVGNAGNVGDGNASADVPSPKAADLVRFALEGGPMFPDAIAEVTGLAYGTVKKVVSQLRGEGMVEDTGETRGQSRQVRLTKHRPVPRDVLMVEKGPEDEEEIA